MGRAFSGAAVELALASYPGFHLTAPPGDAQPYGVFTAAYLNRSQVGQIAVLPDGRSVEVGDPGVTMALEPAAPPVVPVWAGSGPARRAPLGAVAGALYASGMTGKTIRRTVIDLAHNRGEVWRRATFRPRASS